MVYQRGTGSVELELSKVQSVLEVLDPRVEKLETRVDSLESSRDKMDGKLVIIVWLVGLNVTLMIGLILTLFTWGLSHISLKANFGELSTQQDAGNSQAYTQAEKAR